MNKDTKEFLEKYLTPEERQELDKRIKSLSEYVALLVITVKGRIEKWRSN